MDENNQISNQQAETQDAEVMVKQSEIETKIESSSVQSSQKQPSPKKISQAESSQGQVQTSPIQNQTQNTKKNGVGKDDLWYIDNYILLRDYYDRTISRIAARCVRMGNIAIEEYPQYSYILDVLEEISETGNYVLQHKELHPYVERKIKGGVEALRKNLAEYEDELQKNSSPDMIKEDKGELSKMKDALGGIVTDDPTKGAGMSMDDLMNKLMKQNNIDESQYDNHDENVATPDIKPGPKQI